MSITSHSMYNLMLQGKTDYAMYMVNDAGIILNWSPGAQARKGYAARDVIGKTYEIFYPRADRSCGIPARNLVLARKNGRINIEGWRYRGDGSRFWAVSTIEAIYDNKGVFLAFAKIAREKLIDLTC